MAEGAENTRGQPEAGQLVESSLVAAISQHRASTGACFLGEQGSCAAVATPVRVDVARVRRFGEKRVRRHIVGARPAFA
jgi:hypothetical protein